MASEQPPPIVSVNCIHNGQFYCAGTAVPFTETDLPAALRPFVASADAPGLAGEPPHEGFYDEGVIYNVASEGRAGRALRRQAAQLHAAALEQDRVPQESERPLPEGTREILEDAHAASIRVALKQAEVNQRLRDAAYEHLKEQEEKARSQYFVRRGGEWGRARLKVGETFFVRRPSGEMEAVGVVDSRGEPTPPAITT